MTSMGRSLGHEKSATPDSLGHQAARGLTWTYASLAAVVAFQMLYAAVMSRLLTPSDFGLFALAGVVLRLGAFASQLGLVSALVQRPQIDDAHIRAGFTYGLLIACTVAFALSAASEPISHLLGDESLSGVIEWLSADFIVVALGAPALAVLRRGLRFRAIALIEVASFTFGYLIVGITCGLAGFGVWSLVAAALAQSAAESVVAYSMVRHPLRLSLSVRAAKDLISFGGKVSLLGLLEYFGQNGDSVAVGRTLGAAPLGQYSKAGSLALLPLQQLASGVTRVLFPSFSRAESDDQVRRAFISGFAIVSAVLVPAAMWLAASGRDAIPLLYGAQWGEASMLMPIVVSAAGVNMTSLLPAVVCEARGFLSAKLKLQGWILALFVLSLASVAWISPHLASFAFVWLGVELLRLSGYIVIMRKKLSVRPASWFRPLGEAGLIGLPVILVHAMLAASVTNVAVRFAIETTAAASLTLLLYSCNLNWAFRREIRDRRFMEVFSRPQLRRVIERVVG